MFNDKKRPVSTIGTRKESSLHKALKLQYSGGGGTTETLSGTYVCDARTSKGELIEVQTGSFGPLKEKAANLAKKNKVRIIHPIIVRKIIELFDNDGKLLSKRKSPRKGSEWDLFDALIYAPELPLLKNLSIELVLIDITEKRVKDGKGSWRRKGVSIADRFLAAWHDSFILKSPKDYGRFIPFKKSEQFTAKEFAEKAGISVAIAQKALYVLTKIALTERVGKQGNSFIYKQR